MQIHELNTFTGDMTESVFFAVDDGTETSKVPASDVVTTMSAILNYFYPVGSYYETSDTSFNPNTAWGGTWVKEIAGQVHVSAGTGYSVSGANTNTSDGGEATHTLTIDEMPSHGHNVYLSGGSIEAATGRLVWERNTAQQFGGSMTDTGGNQAHNIMQPYIVVNRWHRTA